MSSIGRLARSILPKNFSLRACYFSRIARNVNKVHQYLQRAKLIDSIRLCLRSNAPEAYLLNILSSSSVDSFVVANALRSAPSPASALYLIESLKKIERFSHSKHTLHALAKILARSGQVDKLGALVDAINSRKFVNVGGVSFMDRMRWFAEAGELNEVIGIWQQWRRTLVEHPCTESYNIILKLFVEKGMDNDALKLFGTIIQEGALPNTRTYTIVIQHLIKLGKIDSAMEVFQILPLMRIKRTLKQYSLLVDAFTEASHLDVVQTLLQEMQDDGILPCQAMVSSLRCMIDSGFVAVAEELISELMPDSRIEKISYSIDSSEDDIDDEDNESATRHATEVKEVRLKPWMDPAALSRALQYWEPEEVSALENANFLWTSKLVCKFLRSFKSPQTAWQFFSWVASQPGFVHDIYTVSRMITKLAKHGHVQLVDQLLLKLRREGMKLSFSTVRLIIDFYGFSKNGDAALNIFRNIRTICNPLSSTRLQILYSSLLRTLAKCQMNNEALNTLDEMLLSDVVPDIQTFSVLMHHYALQGDIRTVQRLFGMVRQCSLEPDGYMYKTLIYAYCRCERASLAERMFQDMRDSGLMPDAATKDYLVKSLWKEGYLREAARVEETTEGILPASPGNHYTVSSADLERVHNLYARSITSKHTAEPGAAPLSYPTAFI